MRMVSSSRWWLLAVLAVFAPAGSSLATPTAAAAPGCSIGHPSDPLSTHRVHVIPGGGCVWLQHPDTGFYSIGPAFQFRMKGHQDSSALPRDPIGDAQAVCRFSRFFLSWPTFVVTAKRVDWEDGTGCHDLAGGAAVIWWGHFVLRPRQGLRPAHWEAVVDATSPPLRR